MARKNRRNKTDKYGKKFSSGLTSSFKGQTKRGGFEVEPTPTSIRNEQQRAEAKRREEAEKRRAQFGDRYRVQETPTAQKPTGKTTATKKDVRDDNDVR